MNIKYTLFPQRSRSIAAYDILDILEHGYGQKPDAVFTINQIIVPCIGATLIFPSVNGVTGMDGKSVDYKVVDVRYYYPSVADNYYGSDHPSAGADVVAVRKD